MSRPSVSSRFLWVLGAGLVVLGVLFWLGHAPSKQSLQQWKARMIARGEKFGIDELAPPPAPHDPNLDRFMAAADRLRGRSFKPADFLWLNFIAPGAARPRWLETNLAGRYTRTTSTWAQITVELQSARDDLDDIRAAVRQPADSSVNNYRAPIAPNFVQKRIAAQWLACDALDQLHAGNLPTAQGAVVALARLSRLHQDDLTVVNQMIRAAISGLDFEVTWEALQSPGWTEPQLAELQAEWERIAFLEKMPQTLEMERARIVELFERARTNGLNQAPIGGTPATAPGRGLKSVLQDHFLDGFWRLAWAEQDEMFYLENTQRVIEVIRRARAERSWRSVAGELGAIYDRIESRRNAFDSFRYPLSGITLADFRRGFEAIMRQETQRNLMIAAVALERYRLRHGSFPTNLQSLVPEFLVSVPVDYMDGGPMRYGLESDGSFRLYSVGLDGADDGGDPSPAIAWIKDSEIWNGRDAVWPRQADSKALRPVPVAEVLPLVQFEDAPVTDVIELLARQAGVQVRTDPAVVRQSFPPVTLRLENVTALGALETVVSRNGLMIVKHPGTNLIGITLK